MCFLVSTASPTTLILLKRCHRAGIPITRKKDTARKDCPYLDSIDRKLLDFDLEKGLRCSSCSLVLSITRSHSRSLLSPFFFFFFCSLSLSLSPSLSPSLPVARARVLTVTLFLCPSVCSLTV